MPDVHRSRRCSREIHWLGGFFFFLSNAPNAQALTTRLGAVGAPRAMDWLTPARYLLLATRYPLRRWHRCYKTDSTLAWARPARWLPVPAHAVPLCRREKAQGWRQRLQRAYCTMLSVNGPWHAGG